MPKVAKSSSRGQSGTRNHAGSSRKRARSKSPAKVSVAAMKRELLASAETKTMVYQNRFSYYHNVPHTIVENFFVKLAQGALTYERLSDEIYVDDIVIRMHICPSRDRRYQTTRFTCLASSMNGKQLEDFCLNAHGDNQDNDVNDDMLCAFLDTHNCRVYKDDIIQANLMAPLNGMPCQIGQAVIDASTFQETNRYPGANIGASPAANPGTYLVQYTIPVKKKVTYSDATTIFGANNLYMFYTAFENANTFSSDIIGQCFFEACLNFKDSP